MPLPLVPRRAAAIATTFLVAVLVLGATPRADAAGLSPADIDQLLAEAQQAAGVVSAPPATDEEFLRRLSLDVRGIIPSIEEVLAFTADTAPDKRAQWIDKFLASEERGRHWATYWDKVLVGKMDQPGNAMAQQALKGPWKEWVAQQFNDNVPYDQFARTIMTAKGTNTDAPYILPLARWQTNPANMAGSMSRVFLGANIQCAQCHDHKENASMTQEKFWQFAAFYGNVRVAQLRDPETKKYNGIEVLERGRKWQIEIPDSQPKKSVTPKYLDGTAPTQQVVDADGNSISIREQLAMGRKFRQSGGKEMVEQARMAPDALTPDMVEEIRAKVPDIQDTRREQLAAIILDKDERQFAQNLANRIWARDFGRGLLDPVDMWDAGVRPDHPRLLDKLGDELRRSNWDVRALERLILNTDAYARSSRPTATSGAHPEMFAHAAVRPLAPEQLLDSLARATDNEDMLRTDDAGGGELLPNGYRRPTLRDRYLQQFLFAFGSDELEWTNTFTNSIPRSLFLLNDKALNTAVSSGKGTTLARLAVTTTDPGETVDYLYLVALSRRPSEDERRALTEELTAAQQRSATEFKTAKEDAFWALLASTEFMTTH